MKRFGFCFGIALALFIAGCSSHPEITVQDIVRNLIGRDIAQGLSGWTVDEAYGEGIDVTIIESKYKGDKATLIVEIRTEFRIRYQRAEGGGKLRLHYEWITNEWTLVKVENLDFKWRYR